MQLKLLALIGMATFLLVSCAPPPNPDAEGFQNYDTKKSPQAAAIPDKPVDQPINQLKPITNQKGTMKTLTDFEPINASQATIVTTKGNITFTLYQDLAPTTVANFLNLAKSGYYDGIVFHRVIEDFMAQVGDPLTKDPSKQAMWGSGGPGYTIPDEFGAGLTHDSEGIVSMANAGPGTGGSQFFITYGPTTWLDGKHAIFGKVTEGMDVLRQITVGDKIVSISYQ